MLQIDLAINTMRNIRSIAKITVARGGAHHRLKHHYYYDYRAKVDDQHFTGVVLHNYDSMAIALVQKVTKDIVRQQKEARHAETTNSL